MDTNARTSLPGWMPEQLEPMAERLFEVAQGGVERVQEYLATPEGRRLRRTVARTLIVGAPLLLKVPRLRRHWAIRLLELAGGAALLAKLAETIRDWEPPTQAAPVARP